MEKQVARPGCRSTHLNTLLSQRSS